MDSERWTGSSSTCSLSSSSSMCCTVDVPPDQMVKIEIEAAEALADLAQLAMRENGPDSTGRKWGMKGKRARKVVKSELPASDSPCVDSLPTRSDLVEDQAVAGQQLPEKLFRKVFTEPVKAEPDSNRKIVKEESDAELSKPSPICATNYTSFGSGRSRRNITEAEKEARRIRRILANRESARQTIRRRQALCEELTRKAADLAWENENLKKEKELASKEYQSLEITNRHLKEQMAKAMESEVEETQKENKSAHDHTSPSSPNNSPLFLYNRSPFTHLFWPTMIQSSCHHQSQQGMQNAVFIPSNTHIPSNVNSESSHEKEHLTNINGANSPYYILPYSWFFPHLDPSSQLQPIGQENKQEEETSKNYQYKSNSSISASHLENNQSPLPSKSKTESTGLMDGGHTKTLFETKECVGHVPSLKPEYRTEANHAPPTKARHSLITFPENNHEAVVNTSKKVVDAVAAAEARKRRKELTKLKNLNGRQCRMQC